MRFDQFRNVRVMARHYENFPILILRHVFGLSQEDLVLRNGSRIDLRRCKSFQFVALARLLESGWKVRGVEQDRLLLYNDSRSVFVICRYTTGGDIHNLCEIFVDEFYGSDFKDKVVIDVGMSNGDSALYFAHSGAKLTIGLEPYPLSFALACENVSANKMEDRIMTLNSALSYSSNSVDLFVSEDAPNVSSMNPPREISGNYQFTGKMSVESLTLEDLMKRCNLEKIDLLKMDCEGCEYEVISKMSEDTLKCVGEIVLEFHDGPQQLPAILNKAGYKVLFDKAKVGYLHARRVPMIPC